MSSPRSGFVSPSLSPGPNIRRLAEQFLNSLPDDSPIAGSRSINGRPGVNGSSRRSVSIPTGASNASASPTSQQSESDSMPVTYEPSEDGEGWQRLHDELVRFHEVCQLDQRRNQTLRDDLLSRTRWSIRAVWPTAEVDLVGSVAAGVALPKSDLDFVIWFDATREQPKMYSYTTGPSGGPMPELPYIVLDDKGEQTSGGAAGESGLPLLHREDKEALAGSPLHSSVATASPLSTTSTISNTSTSSSYSRLSQASSTASSALVSPSNSASLPPSVSTSPTLSTTSLPPFHHYFAHAGALIKLIGGRKKSKLLFRSTKIQVFKDINLIRLRDGCSGVSMDLWFPNEAHVVRRSQRHVDEVKGYLQRWRWMGVLAVVVKTFMQQQLLNSGYSGLGSYGVLLMIVRYLQARSERKAAGSGRAGASQSTAAEVEEESAKGNGVAHGAGDATSSAVVESDDDESNVGRLLCGFFRFWAEFDYVNLGVDVRGDGCYVDKPPILHGHRKNSRNPGPNGGGGGVDSDDDEQPNTHSAHEAAADDVDSDAAASGARPRRAGLVSERLSLVIVDPCDASNSIVCYHKALRNMIAAFVQAVAILDPAGPPAVARPEVVQMAELEDVLPAAAASSASSSAACSVVGSTASTAPASPLTSKPGSASATPNSTTRTSPALQSSSTPLHAAAQPAALHLHPQRSRFHRLVDFNQARLGPSMKLCPSAACQLADGTSTQCPVQNKVCYTCGHTFTKLSGGDGRPTHPTGLQQQKPKAMSSDGQVLYSQVGSRRARGKGGKAQAVQATTAAAPAVAATPAVSHTYSPPLNKVMANGTIANTNGMKFVTPPTGSPPAAKPVAPARPHNGPAGGFVYVNSPPLSIAVGVPATPPPFSLSMPVTPYYPPGAAGAGYYGGYDAAYQYAPYGQPLMQQSGGGGGKRFHGQRGGRGGGMGGNRSYGAAMPQPAYYDPALAAPAPYIAAPGFYPPTPPLGPAGPAYFVPPAALPHAMPVGRY